MKKISFQKQIIWGLLACSLSFAACNNDAPAPSGNTKTIKSLFQELKSTPQTFMVTAGTLQTITGARGTRITFHPQSFKDLGGNIINAGDIKIELIEMYKPGDMIANNVTTATMGGQPLTSGGSVNIRATLNQHEVFANNYSISFKQPADSDNPMALFMGVVSSDSTGNNVRWSDEASDTVARTVKNPENQLFYYAFDSCTSFSWINCDYFASLAGPKTDITLIAPDAGYDRSNTQIFVIFPAINSVTSMYGYNAATHAFTFGYPAYNLPIGTNVHILIVGSKNDEYFMDLHQNVTVTNGMTINFTPTTATLSSIQTVLSGL